MELGGKGYRSMKKENGLLCGFFRKICDALFEHLSFRRQTNAQDRHPSKLHSLRKVRVANAFIECIPVRPIVNREVKSICEHSV